MKRFGFILATLATLLVAGCRCTTTRTSAMLLDSSYATDQHVIVVHTNIPVRIMESMKKFEANPNITGPDIDAGARLQSKEVKYVNKGDRIRIGEEAPSTN